MEIYSLLKKFNKLKSSRLKLLAIYLMHITRRRYLGIFFDPVLGCNLRCKMCYFSDENKRKEFKGVITDKQLDEISNAFFYKALKLQIGCGTEPTLYKNLPQIIDLAKRKHIPFISLTTNANLLSEELIKDCLEAGLNEIVISMHGVTKETYEFFMTNAKYEKFVETLNLLSVAKEKHDFKIRINYTMNEENVDELILLFEKFGRFKFDVIQLRPISSMGNTEYHNFTHSKIIERYESVLLKVKDEANKRGIICILPSKNQLITQEADNSNQLIFRSTYCYISPNYHWRSDFNLEKETFDSYSKRKNSSVELFKNIFYSKKKLNKDKKHLNYEIN